MILLPGQQGRAHRVAVVGRRAEDMRALEAGALDDQPVGRRVQQTAAAQRDIARPGVPLQPVEIGHHDIAEDLLGGVREIGHRGGRLLRPAAIAFEALVDLVGLGEPTLDEV